MSFYCYGLNHKTAPIDIREKVALGSKQLPKALLALKGFDEIDSGFILSTCNRTEYYLWSGSGIASRQTLKSFVRDFHGVDMGILAAHVYAYKNQQAVQHLFEVVSGLDSMVLGEDEIVAQFKKAYQTAGELKTVNSPMHSILQKALNVGKKVRTQTSISKSPASVGSVALDLVKSIFENLEGLNVMMVGAGDIAVTTLRNLLKQSVGKIWITNRTFEKAQELAKEFQAQAISFGEIKNYLSETDILISSTGAPHVMFHADTYHELLKHRKKRYLILIDLAVPRDIDPKFSEFENVFLYDIDAFQKIASQNLNKRKAEVEHAKQVIQAEGVQLNHLFDSQKVSNTIQLLRTQMSEMQKQELKKFLEKNQSLSPVEVERLEVFAGQLVNQFLNRPVSKLNEVGRNGSSAQIQQLVKQLFNIE